MAWNEPGGSGKKDPWGGGGGPGKDQGPPDLDAVIKNFQDKLSGMFGGKKGGGSSGGSNSSGGGMSSLFTLIIGVVLVVWALSGVYIVDSAERGVVTRFGAYSDTTMPGPHWHLPFPFERVEVVDVEQNRTVEIGFRENSGSHRLVTIPQEALMLTQDENIVDIKFAVQYQVGDAKNYLFNVRDADETLRHATESAVREVIGKAKMDFVLTEGQSDIADRVETGLQQILDRYQTGLLVTSVNLQSAQPPEEVRDAFEDAIKAREDQQRLINEAKAYSSDIIPKARGNAARQLEEANAYKERIVAQAEGEASRFDQLVAEYKRAPQVTRQRLYIDTMQSVMQSTSKVMVDVKGGNSMLYLPLDKIMSASGQPIQVMPSPPVSANPPAPQPEQGARDNLRSRTGR
ncbi:MAG: FtsH protease activity modulator HflK [Gammaproteobacteria bacterium]|nr:FtsH protease activity modulator HflK [Gammaproteobacteria bacterium]